MKKTIKLLSLILAVVCIALCFTGCRNVETLKKSRMNWANKNHTAIEFDGKTYKQLPYNEYFNVDTTAYGAYFVCEKDIPLLLATEYFYGTAVSISFDRNFIYAIGEYYVIESDYEKYVDIIKNSQLDKYCISEEYYKSNTPYNITKVLSDEEIDVINAALNAKVIATPPENQRYSMGSVTKCDETGCLKSDWLIFYCFKSPDSLYLYDDGEYYLLPVDYYESILDIIKKNNYDYFEGEGLFADESVKD